MEQIVTAQCVAMVGSWIWILVPALVFSQNLFIYRQKIVQVRTIGMFVCDNKEIRVGLQISLFFGVDLLKKYFSQFIGRSVRTCNIEMKSLVWWLQESAKEGHWIYMKLWKRRALLLFKMDLSDNLALCLLMDCFCGTFWCSLWLSLDTTLYA